MLLRVQSNDERWHVDNLLSNSDVSLSDKDTSVVDRLGQTKLENLCLQSSLKEVLDSESENVIELHASLVENSDADQSSNQGITLEQSLWVLVIQCQELTSSSTDFRESKQYPEQVRLSPVQLVFFNRSRTARFLSCFEDRTLLRASAQHRDGQTRRVFVGPCKPANCQHPLKSESFER